MEQTEPTTDSDPLTDWCSVQDWTSVDNNVGDAPTQPAKLFQWLCDQNLPQLEDETPPSEFYEVLDTTDVENYCDNCAKQLVAQLLQRSISTQTIAEEFGQLATKSEAETQTILTVRRMQQSSDQLSVRSVDSQTQTTSQEEGNLENVNGVMAIEIARITVLQATEEEGTTNETSETAVAVAVPVEHVRTQTQTEVTQTSTRSSRHPVGRSGSVPQPLLLVAQDVFTLRLRGRSVWSLLKAILVIVSLLHGCYVLGGSLYRLPLLRRLFFRAQSICAPPPPQSPQPPQPVQPTRSLPSFIWGQLCRLASKLHFV